MNRWVSSLCGILLGCAFCIPPGLLLLLIYGLCLTDPSRPDYQATKLRMMFTMPDPGLLTWMGVTGVFLGLAMAIVEGIRPFLARPPARLSNVLKADMADIRGTFGQTSSYRQEDERIILVHPDGVCEPNPKQAKVSR
jgi:hypothetical protein